MYRSFVLNFYYINVFPIFKNSLFSSCLRFFSLVSFFCPLLDNEIVCFLKVQLAEAINLQDKNLMAQLQETMRCVSRFDNRTCRKLLASIAEDYRYLVQCLCSSGLPIHVFIHQQVGEFPVVLSCNLPNQVIALLLPHERMQLSHPHVRQTSEFRHCFVLKATSERILCTTAQQFVKLLASVSLYCQSDIKIWCESDVPIALGKELHISLI